MAPSDGENLMGKSKDQAREIWDRVCALFLYLVIELSYPLAIMFFPSKPPFLTTRKKKEKKTGN